MRNLILLILLILISIPVVSNADTKHDIEKANKKGKVVFLVVTEKGNSQNRKAINLAQKAQKLFPKSSVIELDRSNSSNSYLIKKYQLSGAPAPLILVIAKNGIVTGGSLLQGLSADKLVSMIPTPKLEEVYSSIAKSKPVILMFTKKSFKDRSKVNSECNKAITMLKKDGVAAKLIEVNINDKKETNFLKQLRIDKNTKSSVVLVINKQGQVSGTATTVPDANKLAKAATTIPKGGCGPGCGPAGCGK